MTSFKQADANRRNARKITSSITEEGKQRSRCNAVCRRLTAETVIGALEYAEDYRAFEAAIIADYDAQSATERELVLSLASLLWRLRRASAMEIGLFEIQADHLRGFWEARKLQPASRRAVYAFFRPAVIDSYGSDESKPATNGADLLVEFEPWAKEPACNCGLLTQCFLRLANLPNCALDRLSRYEYALWRQVGQLLFALDSLDRRKPGREGAIFLSTGGKDCRARRARRVVHDNRSGNRTRARQEWSSVCGSTNPLARSQATHLAASTARYAPALQEPNPRTAPAAARDGARGIGQSLWPFAPSLCRPERKSAGWDQALRARAN
jgi:hypothetical protein